MLWLGNKYFPFIFLAVCIYGLQLWLTPSRLEDKPNPADPLTLVASHLHILW